MTAVDHAELKRLEERIAEIAALFGVPDGGRYLNDWRARAEQHAALLSEIEGLKAERDAYREAAHLEAVCGDDAERQLTALRTQAPDSWRPSNVEVDNILWACEQSEAGIKRHGLPASEAEVPVSTEWLRKACAALRPQTAESGT